MKRVFYALIVVLISSVFYHVPVQGKTTKDSTQSETVYYGAQKGDVSISFSATPIINFIGNMFNGTTKQTIDGLSGVNSSIFSGSTISGRYFVTNKFSVQLGAGFNNSTTKSYSYDENYEIQESVRTSGSKDLMFMLGANYLVCPGKRLQPILGANFVYGYTSKNFEKNEDRDDPEANYNNKKPSNTIGIIADLGVEYFFCPSISMSAFIDLGLTSTISRNKVHNSSTDDSYVTSKQTKFMTGKMGGNLAINFYF